MNRVFLRRTERQMHMLDLVCEEVSLSSMGFQRGLLPFFLDATEGQSLTMKSPPGGPV